ncbi:MAG: hypothetical protein HMLKMBBP_03452 [Planctomycetes bacterium]|nr:hypothetical protein [Planctomycetota bacterium]
MRLSPVRQAARTASSDAACDAASRRARRPRSAAACSRSVSSPIFSSSIESFSPSSTNLFTPTITRSPLSSARWNS